MCVSKDCTAWFIVWSSAHASLANTLLFFYTFLLLFFPFTLLLLWGLLACLKSLSSLSFRVLRLFITLLEVLRLLTFAKNYAQSFILDKPWLIQDRFIGLGGDNEDFSLGSCLGTIVVGHDHAAFSILIIGSVEAVPAVTVFTPLQARWFIDWLPSCSGQLC